MGPDEVPPSYHQGATDGIPMVTCRVCQSMIDITTKRDQHVVKCNHCNEATVSRRRFNILKNLSKLFGVIFFK